MNRILCMLIFLLTLTNIYAQNKKQSVILPDGSYFPIKEGEAPWEALNEARKLYPRAFGLEKIPDNKKFDLTWFNSCRLNSVKEAKTDIAASQMVMSCRELAVPYKCRNFQITKDDVGNEFGSERVQCVEECEKANYFTKTYGECKKG